MPPTNSSPGAGRKHAAVYVSLHRGEERPPLDEQVVRLLPRLANQGYQVDQAGPLSAVATETGSMSPWHEPLPDEWSAVDRAIEVKLAPPPLVAALVGSCGWPYSAAD